MLHFTYPKYMPVSSECMAMLSTTPESGLYYCVLEQRYNHPDSTWHFLYNVGARKDSTMTAAVFDTCKVGVRLEYSSWFRIRCYDLSMNLSCWSDSTFKSMSWPLVIKDLK